MRSGALRERVWLQTAARAQDAVGGAVITWTNTVHLWAQINATGGTDSEDDGKQRAATNYKVTIRYRTGIDAVQNRLLWGSTPLAITAVLPDPKKRFMNLDCQSGRANVA